MSTKPQTCFYCQRQLTSFYKFLNCFHVICTNCLFQKIFVNNIQDLKGENDFITVKCKCANGELNQSLNDISIIIKKKTKMDEENKKNDIDEVKLKLCPNHSSKFLNYYCIECFTYVCQDCQSSETNEHHTHRIVESEKLKKIIKNNINNILFLNFNSEKFKLICDEVAKQIQNEVEKEFNERLKFIDKTIQEFCEFREGYIQKYKEEIKRIIQTFKIIKIYYMNYYNDLQIVKNGQNSYKDININFLRYVNNISYEFGNFMIGKSEKFNQKIIDIKNIIEEIKKPKINVLKCEFYFTEAKRDYIIEDIIQKAHGAYITGLVELKNEQILTSCRKEFLMKIFQYDDKNNTYVEKVQKKGNCGCLLYLEDTNKIISGDGNGIISVYEEKDPKKPNDYIKTQTMQSHDGSVNCLSKLPEKRIVSGGIDGKLVIWEEQDNQYYPINTIKIGQKPIVVVLGLFDSRIAFSYDEVINIYKINNSLSQVQKELCKYIEEDKLIKHKGIVYCLCQLNQGYVVSGGTDKMEGDKEIKDHYIVVWRPNNKDKYILSQTLKNHRGGINSIIELRDHNFASSSYDRSVKIWRPKKTKNNENEEFEMYELCYDLKQYEHGIHKLIQLKDDRLCATSSRNELIFWRNRSGSY